MKAHRSFPAIVLWVATLTALPASEMLAQQSRRGPSAYQRYQQQMKAQRKQMEEVARIARERNQAVERTVLQTFDTNNNGKIDGPEKGAVDAFLRHLRTGKADKANNGTLALQAELVQVGQRKAAPSQGQAKTKK